jgi:sigma-54-specific transcriptional regulator
MILGETGTGKEIVARHLHQLSRRSAGPLVAVNCGAFSPSLVESELFGHERGAFTGALTGQPGWFEAAQGGTLFLDEIGDLPPAVQVRLLRVLQEREVVRLGSRQPIPIDVRLIAATNVDLEEAVRAGRFREDLYYRLNVAPLSIPPLRERPRDIPPLARHFAELYGRRLGGPPAILTPEAMLRLLEHRWPGNIRELENVIHHALLVGRAGRIGPDDLRLARVGPVAAPSPAGPPSAPARGGAEQTLDAALLDLFEEGHPNLWERIEEAVMRAAYRYSEKNQLQTARLLGISRNVVRARLIQFGDLIGAPRPGPARERDRQGLREIRADVPQVSRRGAIRGSSFPI